MELWKEAVFTVSFLSNLLDIKSFTQQDLLLASSSLIKYIIVTHTKQAHHNAENSRFIYAR